MSNKNTLQVKNLTVDKLKEALGIDSLKPLFSWNLCSSKRGLNQAACRIIVSSEFELVKGDSGDMWDSGKMETCSTLNFEYAGKRLSGNQRYWWKVKVWDNNEKEWESEANFFDTGLFQEDWKAKWIWKSNNIKINDFAGFSKDILVKKQIKHAKIYVSAHNLFKLFLNGEKISGYMTPVPSHILKSKYYLSYDITSKLVSGTNSISAIVHYLGGSGQNYMNGLPGFILQCEILFADGSRETVITDETWEAYDRTPYKNGTEYQQNRRISAIEEYDSRIGGEAISTDDQRKPIATKAVLSKINEEKWVMVSQKIPEGFIDEEIIPKAEKTQKPGLQVFDMGKITTGWPKLNLKGYKDAEIMVRYSENLDEHGRVGHNVANEKSETHYDKYIMSGKEKETFEPDFSYKAFRFAEVTGYPDMISGDNFKMVSSHTGIPYLGYFNSSNSLLNDIYKACIQTQKNNTVGQLVDCTHREQAQYLADSDLQAETLVYNFEALNMIKKVLHDFADAQLEDGTFPFVFPSNIDNSDFDLKIPEWDLHFCTMLWKAYYYYNDKSALEKYYDISKKMLAYYDGKRNPSTGLVPKSEHWHISDWPYQEKKEKTNKIPDNELKDLSCLFNYDIDQDGEFLTVQNIKFYNDLKLMSKMAGVLGKNEDVKFYEQRVNEVKNAILKNMYNKDKKLFVDCYGSNKSHQGTNVLALEFGLVPESDRESVIEYVKSKGLGCQTVLSLDLLRVLFEIGEGELAFSFLNSAEFPSWGYMIANGSGTIWEGYLDVSSHCHAWNAYPARLFAEYITGIKPASPGFEKIEIKPFLPESLSFAEAKVPTVYGEVYSGWEKTNDSTVIKLSIPANTSAKVYIPVEKSESCSIKESGSRIWENGKAFDELDEIKYIETDKNGIVLQVKSGDYCFEVK